MKADGSGMVRLTDPGEGVQPHWSPDGKRIVYLRYGGEERLDDIWVMNADGSGARRVVGLQGYESDSSWTPSGKVLYGHNGNMFVVNLDGSGRVQLTNGTHIGDSGNAQVESASFTRGASTSVSARRPRPLRPRRNRASRAAVLAPR